MIYKKLNFLPALMVISCLGCEYNTLEEPVDCAILNLAVAVTAKQDANCGQNNGSVEVLASGGSGVYSYAINQGPFGSSSVFQNLGAGQYTVKVNDNSCTSTTTVDILNEGSGLNISVASTEAGCGTNQGSITITTIGGQAPFEFSVNGGAFGSSGTFQNLSHGNYTLVAKDASACEVQQTVNLKSGISFSNSVSGIIQSNCAISGCHVSGAQSPNLTTLANIQANASSIKSRTGNRSMPLGRTLTQSQINAIACWVDDGAVNN